MHIYLLFDVTLTERVSPVYQISHSEPWQERGPSKPSLYIFI